MFREIPFDELWSGAYSIEQLSDDGGIGKTERKILIEQLFSRATLTGKERRVVRLFLNGYTQEEIASKTRLCQRQVRRIYARAVAKMSAIS